MIFQMRWMDMAFGVQRRYAKSKGRKCTLVMKDGVQSGMNGYT